MTDAEALYDDLAGIVDLFGALSRAELGRALDELAFKQGRDADADALSAAVEDAVREYYLVAYDRDGVELLVPGPAAFPSLPENAEDLPHILDVDRREVDGEAAADATLARLRSDADAAVEAGDDDRIEHLLDVTYDAELWAPGGANVDLSGETDANVESVRSRLEGALDA
ncbi:hypothetical protein C474_17769 [Halogeometricum pallidum JCM 14848]|uniref:Uncharacterized protein n=1 Tax=Halogeometricum pallidum JCM 14848 TaxID=1227487 RepID=M0CX49_HALPD|nr:hypothetical protein [Halogeometricum pallidum]ELZ27218.1 hypothetical protein C474_17769 [Halogeometricum pallidum JCM 14848]